MKEGTGVKAGDFSDRVGGYRKGYRVTGRREGEDEGLEARIARLRREVEECRIAAGRSEESGKSEGGGEGEMEGLRRVLDGLDTSRTRSLGRRTELAREEEEVHDEGGTLGKVAGFDARLAALERTLGADATATTAPVVPSLQVLDEQLSALMTANSLASLEAASARVRKLREEAEHASHLTNGAGTPTSESAQDVLPPEDLEKLKSLHALLPTLQSLSPTVPALLDRLRSLRTLHGGAANAASELEDLERRQEEFDTEMKVWREGLERVEGAVREADEANGRNGKVVQQWVKGVEGRVEKLR